MIFFAWIILAFLIAIEIPVGPIGYTGYSHTLVYLHIPPLQFILGFSILAISSTGIFRQPVPECIPTQTNTDVINIFFLWALINVKRKQGKINSIHSLNVP
jgi:hypothetical protein